MNEYTPTTDEVRINYIGTTPEFAAEKPWQEHRPAEFDRWLDAHDAEVREEAWDEGWERGRSDEAYAVTTANPYRKARK